MERVPEPELMADEAQARAYAEADFSEAHDMFVRLLADKHPGLADTGLALDLGCGAADISIRFLRRFPGWRVWAVDGARAMLAEAEQALAREGCQHKVRLLQMDIRETLGLATRFDCLFSNSLLHHLHQPEALWSCVRGHVDGAVAVFLMDLLRPRSLAQVDELVACYAGDAPALLQRDFRHSLMAAFSLEEIRAQLSAAGLHGLVAEQVSDRHVIIHSTYRVV